MKRIVAILLLGLILFTGCSKPPEITLTQGSSGDAVFIKISENSISADASEVVVKNFHAGSRAEMTYRIHNATGKAIQPEIYWIDADVANYSKADGAVKANVQSWLTLPENMDVPAGSIREYIVAIEMPKDAKKPADKIGFQIGVCNKNNDKVQTAIGTWWLVSMR